MGITVTAASAERVTGAMPVDGNIQPYGLLHGGASCVLAETLGSLGAALQAGPGRFAVGIEISATHHRAVTDGMVTGVATRVHGGRTAATYEIAISDDRGRRVCSARLTCLLRDQVPRAAVIRAMSRRPDEQPGHRAATGGQRQGNRTRTGRLSQTGQGTAAPLRRAGTPRYRGGQSPGS